MAYLDHIFHTYACQHSLTTGMRKQYLWTPTQGQGAKGQNSTFSEHGHVAYQIKWNHECSNVSSKYFTRRPRPRP